MPNNLTKSMFIIQVKPYYIKDENKEMEEFDMYLCMIVPI